MAQPIIKYPGGKRNHAVLGSLSKILQERHIDTYVEPFLGGGAPYFHLDGKGLLRDKRVILGDADSELIDLYDAVRRDPAYVHKMAMREVRDLAFFETDKERKSAYNTARELWNLDRKRSGLHLFLRHAVFNGLFRRNRMGGMNSPPRDHLENISIPPLKELEACAAALENVELLDWSFRDYATDDIFFGPGTLLYLDPPYDQAGVQYVKEGFTDEDQRALVEQCVRWAEEGAIVVYTNANTPYVRAVLRRHWPSAQIQEVYATRAIAADGTRRLDAPEIIVTENTHD